MNSRIMVKYTTLTFSTNSSDGDGGPEAKLGTVSTNYKEIKKKNTRKIKPL